MRLTKKYIEVLCAISFMHQTNDYTHYMEKTASCKKSEIFHALIFPKT